MTTLAAVFDQLPGGFLVTDLASRVLYANHAVSERTGYAIPEIIGKKPGELWGGRMPRSFYDFLWHTIGIEGKPFVGRFDNQPKRKQRQFETLQIAPLKNSAGATEYFVEFHPVLPSLAAEKTFHQKFLSEAGMWHQDAAIWQSFLKWLLPTDTGSLFDQIVYSNTSLTDLVREELIFPTQLRLARRFEDTELIRAAQEDAAAFAFLYEKYIELIRLYFSRRIGVREEAEDLSQEVFARAYRSLSRFRVANASYYTYLLHIAHNLLVDHYRGQAKYVCSSHVSLDLLTDESISPNRESLEMLLTSLSPTERLVMSLAYVEGFKAREIAEKLGKTENAVKLMLSRSRKKLRSVLA